MIFDNRKVPSDLHVSINGTDIERVYVTKFLGVLIDCNLSWKDQINNVSKKLSKSIAVIRKASFVLNSDALYTLYCALFLPYLNYCVEVWGNTYHSNIVPIYLKQKKVIRIICKSNYLEHTSPLFNRLKMLKFPQIVNYQTGIFMFKAYHSLLPQNLQNYFSLDINDRYNTKRKYNLKQRRVRTKKKQLSISIAGVQLWNSLNDTLKTCNSIANFKKMYKGKLLSIQN